MTTAVERPPFRHEPSVDFSAPGQNDVFEDALERVRSGLGRTYPLVVGGDVARDKTFPSINPARPGEVVGRHAVATREDVDAALAAAGDAFPTWSQTPVAERASLLFDVADRILARRHEFAALATLEVGKIRAEADGEV